MLLKNAGVQGTPHFKNVGLQGTPPFNKSFVHVSDSGLGELLILYDY